MIYTREKLKEYAEPISDTENEMCKRAIRMVRDALVKAGYDLDEELKQYDEYTFYYEKRDKYGATLTILLQGSYANKTNIKHTSDVDVAILYKPIIPIGFEKYKQSILNALAMHFGKENVERKNKSIKVKGNSARKDIDVVPAFYAKSVRDGIYFYTDNGEKIINYPLQHIDNSKNKNKRTDYNYKRYVRIFKNIKRDLGYEKLGSFQLESLLYNLPDGVFSDYTYSLELGVKLIINSLCSMKHKIRDFKEGNGIKPLIKNDEIYINILMFIELLDKTVELRD